MAQKDALRRNHGDLANADRLPPAVRQLLGKGCILVSDSSGAWESRLYVYPERGHEVQQALNKVFYAGVCLEVHRESASFIHPTTHTSVVLDRLELNAEQAGIIGAVIRLGKQGNPKGLANAVEFSSHGDKKEDIGLGPRFFQALADDALAVKYSHTEKTHRRDKKSPSNQR